MPTSLRRLGVARALGWLAVGFVVSGGVSAWFLLQAIPAGPVPVNVRWKADVTDARRTELEQALRLTDGRPTEGTTWAYSLRDPSTEGIRELVQHPSVDDTAHIDRTSFRPEFAFDRPRRVLVYTAILASLGALGTLLWIAVIAAHLFHATTVLQRQAGRRWRAFLDERSPSDLKTGEAHRLLEPTARALVFLIIASYFYMVMEWIFFATKPSFMSRLTAWEVISIPITTPLALVAAAVPVWAATGLLLSAVRRSRTPAVLVTWALFLAPAAIIAAAALLMVDNFTYSLFEHSVGTVQGPLRYAYAVLFSWGLVALVSTFQRQAGAPFWARHPRTPFVACGVLVSVSLAVAVGNAATRQPAVEHSARPNADRLANVLILSTDGLDADHMSAYGYERDTTPVISALLPELLVAENHLTNSESTNGSIGALLTGKLPTATRVFHSPDAFLDDDVFEHLPGVLREWGYSSVDIGQRFFADAHDMNLRQAFDVGAGRTLESLGPLESLRPRFPSEAYFLEQLQDRINGRLRHAFGVEDLADPLGWQNWNDATMTDDSRRIDDLQRFLNESPRPFFAHVHLLGTHGSRFFPERRHFSSDREQTDPWMTDFYDDSILQFDAYVARVQQFLKNSGDYDNTLIVLNSDHGSQWRIDQRLPLLMRFPGQEHRGYITANTQRIDIAPTILDYLGGKTPTWMAGQSLLGLEPDRLRPIFSFESTESDRDSQGPPFFNLRAVQVALGDHLYRLHLRSAEMHATRLEGHTAPLEEGELPSTAEVRQSIVEHLSDSGYDVSTLDTP